MKKLLGLIGCLIAFTCPAPNYDNWATTNREPHKATFFTNGVNGILTLPHNYNGAFVGNLFSATNASITLGRDVLEIGGATTTKVGKLLVIDGDGAVQASDLLERDYLATDIPVSDRFNPVQAVSQGLDFSPMSVQSVEFAAIPDDFHGLIYLHRPGMTNYVFACTRGDPGRLIRFNANDISQYNVVTFPSDSAHANPDQLVYVPSKEKIYLAFDSVANFTKVTEVDPDTLAYSDVIDDDNCVGGFAFLTSDNVNLYVMKYTGLSPIAKYRLSDYTFLAKTNLGTGVGTPRTNYASHSLVWDGGTNLYMSTLNNIGGGGYDWVSRISTATLDFIPYAFSSNNFGLVFPRSFTDDSAILGDWFYVQSENPDAAGLAKGICLSRIKTDFSVYQNLRLATINAYSYSLSSDGKFLWMVDMTSTNLFRFDPSQMEFREYDLPAMKRPNEIVSDGERVFIAAAGDTGKTLWRVNPSSLPLLRRFIVGTNDTVLTSFDHITGAWEPDILTNNRTAVTILRGETQLSNAWTHVGGNAANAYVNWVTTGDSYLTRNGTTAAQFNSAYWYMHKDTLPSGAVDLGAPLTPWYEIYGRAAKFGGGGPASDNISAKSLNPAVTNHLFTFTCASNSALAFKVTYSIRIWNTNAAAAEPVTNQMRMGDLLVSLANVGTNMQPIDVLDTSVTSKVAGDTNAVVVWDLVATNQQTGAGILSLYVNHTNTMANKPSALQFRYSVLHQLSTNAVTFLP